MEEKMEGETEGERWTDVRKTGKRDGGMDYEGERP